MLTLDTTCLVCIGWNEAGINAKSLAANQVRSHDVGAELGEWLLMAYSRHVT